jgi:hypothetical protein
MGHGSVSDEIKGRRGASNSVNSTTSSSSSSSVSSSSNSSAISSSGSWAPSLLSIGEKGARFRCVM